MKNTLGFLLRSRILPSKQAQSPNGFTLIELLVAMVIAFLVITPLLGFMINILDTERREQAKSTSEQEIQSALDYIAQDMEQAVYIYDADGIYGKAATETTPAITGIIGQIPTDAQKAPVLVFWKRLYLDRDQVVTLSDGTTTKRVGELATLPDNTPNEQDYMVYSLVVYYLVKDSSTTTWNTTTARIARWEIRDGIRDPGGTETREENGVDVNYHLLPNPNFKSFDIASTGDLGTKLGNWTNFNNNVSSYTANTNTLVDFIDQTPFTALSASAATCNADEQKVPNYSDSRVTSTFKTDSFYACVNAKKYIARLYIRGNSLARIQTAATYDTGKAAYFPTANIQIKGRGFLGVE